jgi:hypothetical protein
LEKYNCVTGGTPIRIFNKHTWNLSVGHVKDSKNFVVVDPKLQKSPDEKINSLKPYIDLAKSTQIRSKL